MTTTVSSTSTDAATKGPAPSAWGGHDGKPPSRLRGGGRRHRVPYLLLGVLLVVVCAAGGVLTGMQLGDRENVLALARPVPVGHILTAQDVKQISVAADSAIDAMPASAASSVVGQPIAYSLPAGSLVTRSALGAPQVPASGEAIAAIGLKPGQFPPELMPGTRVAVLVTPEQNTAPNEQPTSWTAVVTGITGGETEQITVVSLQLSDPDARELAAAPAGQLSLVAIAGGGR